MKSNYRQTIFACFVGYIVQAIVNNFVPLLFLTFQDSYGISYSKITLLITINFAVQLSVDLLSAFFIDRIGYRASAIIAHAFSVVGLISLAILPDILPDPFVGLVAAVTLYAIGGGLLEVIVSPVMEACPTDNKEKAMSMLHSFYCWGYVGVVLISTLFFAAFGIENWRVIAFLWAVIPAMNLILFSRVPINSLISDDEAEMKPAALFKNKFFYIFFLLMLCAGASEQSISQWASAFAEAGLGVSKTIGDLAGPMLFATLMGTARAIYGKFGHKIDLEKFMLFSSVLCIGAYLLTALSPNPVLSLISCGICGFSVGIFWPGTFSLACAGIRGGGTLMFAMFALAGDIGCAAGPAIVGNIAELFDGNLNLGIVCGTAFPVLMTGGLLLYRLSRKKAE